MPVEFDDTDDDAQQGASTGKGLRSQLEQALAREADLAKRLRTYEVQDVVGEFDLVSADDLEDVEAEKLKERATEIQTERQALREKVARDLLKAQGVDEADLDKSVNDLLAGSEDAAQAYGRVRQTAEVAGTPAPITNPENLHGRDAIAAGVKG